MSNRYALLGHRTVAWLIVASFFVLAGSVSAQQIFRPPDPPHAVSAGPADQSDRILLAAPRDSISAIYSTVNSSWEGMAQTSTIRPPDPHGAAGPSGIIQTVNLRIAYYNKSGGLTWGPVSLTGSSGFWGTVSNSASNVNSDPRAIYDPASGRFFVVMLEVSSTQSFLNLAVSKSSNPASSGTSDWYFYRLEDTETSGGNTYGTDYPGLGVDAQALYVTYNMYSVPFTSSSTFLNCQIIVLKKADIISGTGTYWLVYTPNGFTNAFTLQPATVLGGVSPGNKAYFGEVSFANTTSVRVWALSDPLGTRTLTSATVTVPNHGGYIDGAPQSGTTTTVPTLSPRTQGNAFWWNSALWFCHTAGGGTGKSSAYYYKVNTNDYPTASPTLAESGHIDGGSGVWTYQPSIGANAVGDVCIVYTQSSSSAYPTIMYTSRLSGAAGFETPAVLKASPGYSNSDRWGDYASVTADPTDNSFWVTHEWAHSTSSHDWSTWWGNIAMAPLPVQLVSFTGSPLRGGLVKLEWKTQSEVNNYGFEVQRSANPSADFQTLPAGFIAGHGTTLVPQWYSFTDSAAAAGDLKYRLKQIDLDGTVHYTDPVQVNFLTNVAEKEIPSEFSLAQNYPNPFNPTTTITYGLPHGADVTLEAYNALGQRIALLVDGKQEMGYHDAVLDGSRFSSGVYFYKLRAGDFISTKKLILMK